MPRLRAYEIPFSLLAVKPRQKVGTFYFCAVSILQNDFWKKIFGGLSQPMVIIVVFGGLVIGGALFAVLKNSGSKSTDDKYTKLDIG
jgi:hypothetical protein